MMIGFMSIAPTLTINCSDINLIHKDRTGQVGIGNIAKYAAKLHIKSDEGELADIFLESSDWASRSKSSIYVGTLGHSVSASAADGMIFNSEKNYQFANGDVGFGLDILSNEEPQARLHIKADKEEIASVFIEPSVWDDGSSPGGGGGGLEIGKDFSVTGAYLMLGNQLHGIGAKRNRGLIFNTESYYEFNDGFLKIGKDAKTGSVLVCTDTKGTAKWHDPTEIGRWLPSGISDIYYNKGNVGIGVEDPMSALEVRGQVAIGFHVANLQENNLLVEGKIGVGLAMPTADLDVNGKTKTLEFQLLNGQLNGNILQCDNEGNATWVDPSLINDGDWTLLANNLYVDPDRFVGIGTNNPTQALDVVGNINLSGNIFGNHNDWQSLRLYANSNENDGAYITMNGISGDAGSIKLFARGIKGRVGFFNANRQIMSVREDNNVYIGDADPLNTSNLIVYGEVKAHIIRATATIGWWDCVFKPDYKLMPLLQLEKFVNENHHLPDMPSEDEVHKDGLDIAEMNALLLKKVEELTLYVIELKKENEGIWEEIDNMKGE